MDRKKTNSNISAIKSLQNAMRNCVAWNDSTTRAIEQISQIMKSYADLSGAEQAIKELQNKINSERMEIIATNSLNTLRLSDAVDFNTQLLSTAASAIATPEISELLKGVANNQVVEAAKKFTQCLLLPEFSGANLGLIRLNTELRNYVDNWNGLSSFIKGINVDTAKALIRDDSIIVNTDEKVFVSKDNVNAIAENDEMNVIISSLSMFDDISAVELMELNSILAEGIEFAMTNHTAQHIFEIIHSWNNYISFDREEYYRARSIEKGKAPFTVKNFGMAPEKYVGYGRYNHDGQSHYYVASTEGGACTEVRKHIKNATLQIATLKPIKEVKLIDFSEKTKVNTFLNYLRFDISDDERVPRAYLLPCFVTSCCRRTEIEGIKYYGSKEYDNCVTWDDSFYKILRVSDIMS